MRIERLRLVSRDPAALGEFYRSVFDAQQHDGGVALGEQIIDMVVANTGDEATFLAHETGFQHFALVVTDIKAAYARLHEAVGWRPISLNGPENLPKASGGAAAFKFRDPCGHPLELLQFPTDGVPPHWRQRFDAAPDRLFPGVDHTALTVSDAETALAFYKGLGFICGHRQINAGAEQRRLDGLDGAGDVKVEILSLSPPDDARPGIELLAYRDPPTIRHQASDGSEAATAMQLSRKAPFVSRDPDGHRIAGAA